MTDAELETTPAMADECERCAELEERDGKPGSAARYRIIAARLRRLYEIYLGVSTDEERS
ncbi:MAG TPA: hypothetical protein VEC57_20825 [Candidatus Limnocylindrales bacterium]|nr:hypothetical protein [Candidatus Limnocylindrales bacterium]